MNKEEETLTDSSLPFPKLVHDGKVFWRVGCKICGEANFHIFATEKKEILSKCSDCDNITEFSKLHFENEAPVKRVFDARLF